jgi:hypothetical protein
MTEGARLARRLPVPLTERDEEELAALRSEYKPLIKQVLGLDGSPSDAALVHAVFDLGLQQLREARSDLAYQALAVSYDDDSARRVARRRRPLSADDE